MDYKDMKPIGLVRLMLTDGVITVEQAAKYFPELGESEDGRIRRAIIQFFELQDDNTTYSFIPKKDILAWLEKQGEQKPWSKEDDKMIVSAEALCDDKIRFTDFQDVKEHVNAIKNWLKSIKERVQPQNNYNPYKAVVESIAEMCEKYKSPTSDLSDFLDNVKVKCKEAKAYDATFPQKHWKPTLEQIGALKLAVDYYDSMGEQCTSELLADILKQLKAL